MSQSHKYIFVGSNKGIIFVYNAENAQFIFEYKVGTSLIKQISISRSGMDMIVNSNDRIIRHFKLDMNPPLKIDAVLKFFDSVEKTQFLDCAFSADGEYVVGACGHRNRHDLYIWDKATGVLGKMLSGPFEGMSDVKVFIR
jgi:COMPASS component SWD1